MANIDNNDLGLYRLPNQRGRFLQGDIIVAFLSLLAVVSLAFVVSTQYVAYQFQFQPALGSPVFSMKHQPLFYPVGLVASALGFFLLFIQGLRGLGVLALATGACMVGLYYTPAVYSPVDLVSWYRRYEAVPGTEKIWSTAQWIVVLPSHLGFFISIGIAYYRSKALSQHTDMHGSAKFADRAEILKSGLLD